MPQSRFSWTLLLIGSFLLGVAWIMESREEPTTAEAASSVMEAPAAGHLAPDFTLETLNGDSLTLSDYRGQPVVLNFWATWCPPCRAEIPFFQAASRTYNGQVAVVGIDDGEPRGIVAPYVAEMGMTYPVPLDETSEVSRRYRISSLPTTFFIDSAGTIQNIHIGILNQAVLDDQISQLLDS